MSRSTISTFQLFAAFPDEETARTYLEGRPALEQQVKSLEEWKRQMTSVYPPIQEIGKEIGVQLGQSIHDKILPWVKDVKVKVDLLEQRERELRELLWMNHARYLPYTHIPYGDDGEMQCCGIDFKRDSPEDISAYLHKRAALNPTEPGGEK